MLYFKLLYLQLQLLVYCFLSEELLAPLLVKLNETSYAILKAPFHRYDFAEIFFHGLLTLNEFALLVMKVAAEVFLSSLAEDSDIIRSGPKIKINTPN